jgi:hypothetical protein
MKKVKTILVATCFSILISIQSFAGWVQNENGQWKYTQGDTAVTNQWIEDNKNWYYVNENGIMLSDTTQEINGTNYTFDTSGKCINPNSSSADNAIRTYINKDIGFSIDIPSNVTTDAFDTDNPYFKVKADGFLINYYYNSVNPNNNPWGEALFYEDQFCKNNGDQLTFDSRSYVKLGDFYVYKSRYLLNTNCPLEFYSYVEGQKVIAITTTYGNDKQDSVLQILNSMKKIS